MILENEANPQTASEPQLYTVVYDEDLSSGGYDTSTFYTIPCISEEVALREWDRLVQEAIKTAQNIGALCGTPIANRDTVDQVFVSPGWLLTYIKNGTGSAFLLNARNAKHIHIDIMVQKVVT